METFFRIFANLPLVTLFYLILTSIGFAKFNIIFVIVAILFDLIDYIW